MAGDPTRVQQVLVNLVGNAIKFTGRGGVKVVLRPQEATSHARVRLAFDVIDTGIGIDREVKDRIFDWFESHAGGSEHRGAGLGLSLVRSFVELHGGTVSVDSTLGQGTTVSVSFPLNQHAHRTAAE